MGGPMIVRYGGYTIPSKSDDLKVGGALSNELVELVTSEDLDLNYIKSGVVKSSSFANGDSLTVDIDDATSDFVSVAVYSSSTSSAPVTKSLTLTSSTIGSWDYSNWDADSAGFFVSPTEGMIDYSGMSSENVTDPTKLRFWSLYSSSDTDIFKSWIASDSSGSLTKTLTVESGDATNKILQMVSDSFRLINAGDTTKINFDFNTHTITAGGTVNYIKVKLVDSVGYDTVLYTSADLWSLGSGSVSATLDSSVMNRRIRVMIEVSFTGAAGPASISFDFGGLEFTDGDSGRVLKLYSLASDTYIKPYPSTYIDYSSLGSGYWRLESLTVSSDVSGHKISGVNVALSKDGNSWYYYANEQWHLIDSTDPYSSTMTATDLADMDADDLDFILRNNADQRIYIMFTPNEDSEPGDMVVSQVAAVFDHVPVLSAVSGVTVEINNRRAVKFTNSSGATINGFVGVVAYV